MEQEILPLSNFIHPHPLNMRNYPDVFRRKGHLEDTGLKGLLLSLGQRIWKPETATVTSSQYCFKNKRIRPDFVVKVNE